MRLSFTNERVLAVVAHPDDAELLCAGTLARAKAEGAAIGICVLCQGDKGQPTPAIENLADVRRAEMKASVALLGAELLRGDFRDGDLTDGPEERSRLIKLFRRFRPTLVLAHFPEDYHPDHRAAAALAEAATWFCASAGQVTMAAPLQAPPALWWMDAVNLTGFVPGFFVDISAYVDLKRKMLFCHQSQIQRGNERSFAPLEDIMLQQCRTRGSQAGVAAAEAFQAYHAWKRGRAW